MTGADVETIFVRHWGAYLYARDHVTDPLSLLADPLSCLATLKRCELAWEADLMNLVAPLFRHDETAADFGVRMGIAPCWREQLELARRAAEMLWFA